MEILFKFYKPCFRLSLTLCIFTIFSFAFFSRKMMGDPQTRVCNKKTAEQEQMMNNQTFLETYEEEISYRNEIVEKICNTYPEFLKMERDFQSLFWHDSSHLGYCYHPKAGSSTWLRLLFSLSNEKFISEDQAKNLAEDLFVREEKDLDFNKAILVNVIQDPFSRLIEGYQSKLRDSGAGILKEKIMQLRTFIDDTDRWSKLLKKHGFSIEKEPTPEEYLVYVVTQLEICESETAPRGCWSLLPTLWKPYHMECSPCAFKYDIISKIETFDNDLKYTRHKIEKLLDQINSNSPNKMDKESLLNKLDNMTDRKEKKKREATNEFALEVSKLLQESDKQRFRRAYRFDYLLFDYNPFEFE